MDIESDGQRLHFANLNKIYFPAVGVKKRELLAYYYRMAQYILPFLKDRPMVLRRYPDGVDGKAFFQKEAPSYLPDWIATATVDSEERGGEMQYILCDSRAVLLYLTNLGCIDHNPWSSRAQSQENPDYVFFDLDPTPDTPFSDVMHVAREIYAMLKSIKMQCFLKTSGASGFHIFIPLEPKYTYEQTRTFAEVVGRLVATDNPKLTTFERTVSKRPKGRILIDALQNAKGKPLACAYSVRAFPKATVSTPLSPDELTTSLSAEQFTFRNFDERIARGRRPLGRLLEETPNSGPRPGIARKKIPKDNRTPSQSRLTKSSQMRPNLSWTSTRIVGNLGGSNSRNPRGPPCDFSPLPSLQLFSPCRFGRRTHLCTESTSATSIARRIPARTSTNSRTARGARKTRSQHRW